MKPKPIMCLSVRGLWAWAIVHGFKPVENRTLSFQCNHLGPFLVHTGKECTKKQYSEAAEKIRAIDPSLKLPPLEKLQLGGIIGRANADRYVTEYPSPWFEGPRGIVLSQAKPLPFVKMGGALGWFPCPPEIVEQLKKLTRAAPPRSTAAAGVDQFPDAF
jgi:hypothetical protein